MRFRIDVNTLDGRLSFEQDAPADAGRAQGQHGKALDLQQLGFRFEAGALRLVMPFLWTAA